MRTGGNVLSFHELSIERFYKALLSLKHLNSNFFTSNYIGEHRAVKMRSFWVAVALMGCLFCPLPGTLAGCNVRSVQVSTADAQNQAIQAITQAFAACTKCPCQIKVQSQAKVVANVSQKIIRRTKGLLL